MSLDANRPSNQQQNPSAPARRNLREGLGPLLHEGDILSAPLEELNAPKPPSAPEQDEQTAEHAPPKQDSKKLYREMILWVSIFAFVLILAFVVRTFVAEPARVDGRSMQDTLQNNEYVLVTKFDYLREGPAFFDVVMCKYPISGETFVKRVVGMPGDTVELRGGDLYVNDVYIAQDFLTRRGTFDFGPVHVPEDHYFVMGDNRPNSQDSRDEDVGALPRDHILGHVQQVIFPFADMRKIWDLR